MLYTADFSESEGFIQKAIDYHKGSCDLAEMNRANAYYDGNNTTINNLRKKIVMKKEGKFREIDNPFQSNKKLSTPVFQDMVNQKVYALLGNTPTVTGISKSTEKALFRHMDKNALYSGKQASINGVGFSFVSAGDTGENFHLTTFDSRQCIPFWDSDLKTVTHFIRYWDRTPPFGEIMEHHAELYTVEGITKYRSDGSDNMSKGETMPYKVISTKNAFSEVVTAKQWENGLPILVFANNDYMKSDFSTALQGAIDAYDYVISDFFNNIVDIKEMVSVVEGAKITDPDILDGLREFYKTLETTGFAMTPKDTKFTPVQRKILFEAKVEFIKQIQSVLQTMTHTVNKDMALTGNLTATGIKLSQQDHKNFVRAFEYPAYDYIVQMVDFAKESSNDTSTEEIDIKFNPDFLANDTETVDNLVKLEGIMSTESILENIPVYVPNMAQELERKKTEKTSMLYASPKSLGGGTSG